MNTYDLVVTGAQLWLPEQSPFTALAVGGGRILALGTDAEILSEAGPDTQRIDAAGRAVLPGFTDAHVHPLAGGRALLGCDLETEHSRDGYARLIRASAQTAGEWVVGSGWFGDVFPGGLPTAEELDALVPDRPAVMTSHDSHGVWVNSRAMQLAGISRDSHDPPAGRIVRDGRGEPTGVLFDTAGELVTRLIPPASKADMRAALLCAQQHLFSLGITGWHDAILGAYLTLQDSVPTYIDLLASRELRGRVSGSLWWSPGDGPDRLPEMLRRIRAVRDAGFAVSSIKIMQDGICENCTAALLEPYDGVHPEVRGDSVIAPDDLAEITAGLDAQGLRVHFHGVGDRAVRECLDAVEHARQMNGAGQPHQIAHLDVVDPADFPRFKALGVTANLQPLWARDDQEILERKYPLLGKDRVRYHFPFGSLHRAGAHLAMGSDWPVTSPDPLWGLYTACTRTAPPDDPHALNPEARKTAQPEERLSLETALRAYTLGSAEASGFSAEAGSIEKGKLADLVVLTGPLSAAEDLGALRVERTVLGGETVFLRAP